MNLFSLGAKDDLGSHLIMFQSQQQLLFTQIDYSRLIESLYVIIMYYKRWIYFADVLSTTACELSFRITVVSFKHKPQTFSRVCLRLKGRVYQFKWRVCRWKRE